LPSGVRAQVDNPPCRLQRSFPAHKIAKPRNQPEFPRTAQAARICGRPLASFYLRSPPQPHPSHKDERLDNPGQRIDIQLQSLTASYFLRERESPLAVRLAARILRHFNATSWPSRSCRYCHYFRPQLRP
jgi:hypothetical protein